MRFVPQDNLVLQLLFLLASIDWVLFGHGDQEMSNVTGSVMVMIQGVLATTCVKLVDAHVEETLILLVRYLHLLRCAQHALMVIEAMA